VSDDDLPTTGPGAHPLVGRQRHLVAFLQVAVAAAMVLAVAGVVLPGRWGTAAGVALVATLVGAPVARVAWLMVRWIRRGDPRFAAVAGALLAVAAAGALSAL
jgi:hypothetical protein